MANATLYLDTRTIVRGKCQVKIQISHRGTNALLGTGVWIERDQWQPSTKDSEAYVKRTCRNYTLYNNSLRSMLDSIDADFSGLRADGTLYSYKTATELKRHIEQVVFTTSKNTFTDFLHEYIGKVNKDTTRQTFIATEQKVAAFSDGHDVRFEDITPRWLGEFEESMADLSVNSRSIHLRNVRTIFNKAISQDVVRQDFYPFRKFKIKSAPTAKRSLTVDELRQLHDFPCEPYQVRYVDWFFLIFYLIGINAVDLFSIKEIINGRVDYIRSKTGKPYSIKVEPEAMAIIERYRGDKHLLSFADEYSDHRTWLNRTNKSLRDVGPVDILPRKNGRPGKKDKHGLFPHISTYWARHTWATIAAELDVPKETIAAALGHGGKTVTDIYINFDARKIDEANRRVIDYVLYKKRPDTSQRPTSDSL